MNVELRKVMYHEGMSDETFCFEAEIWMDGVKLADARNRGTGGSNEYYPVGGYRNPNWKSFHEYCKSQPHHHDSEYVDQYVNSLFVKWIQQRDAKRAQAQVKRWCKTFIVYRLKEDPEGSWWRIKGTYTPSIGDALRKKYGDQLEVIANESQNPPA